MTGNTTPIHGKIARCAYGTAGSGTNIDYVGGWTITPTLDTASIDRQGQHWGEVIPGMARWTASIDASFCPGNTQQKAVLDALVAATPGTKLTGATALAFHGEDAGDHYSGDSYINSVTITANTGDKVSLTISVTGTGVLTQTIA